MRVGAGYGRGKRFSPAAVSDHTERAAVSLSIGRTIGPRTRASGDILLEKSTERSWTTNLRAVFGATFEAHRRALFIGLGPQDFLIPAGDANHKVEETVPLNDLIGLPATTTLFRPVWLRAR